MGARRTNVAILAVVLLGAGGFLVWRFAIRSKPAATGDTSTTTTTIATGSGGPVIPTRQPELPPVERTPPVIAPIDASAASTAPAQMRQGLEDAHAHLRDELAPCFRFAAVKPTVVKFRYKLTVAAKHASTSDGALIEADVDLTGAPLDCILAAFAKTKWSSELPDLVTPIEDQLGGAEL